MQRPITVILFDMKQAARGLATAATVKDSGNT